jgi:hypothetical protein
MATTVTTNRCTPFLLRVMVFSPESGYKFTVEIQKACTGASEAVWKLLFDLFKKDENSGKFVEIISVEFVAGPPDDIATVAAITEEGLKRRQVRAFRDDVFPLVKPFGENGNNPMENDHAVIDSAISSAIHA